MDVQNPHNQMMNLKQKKKKHKLWCMRDEIIVFFKIYLNG